MEIYVKNIIDTKWFLGIERGPYGAKIVLHDRWPRGAIGMPEATGTYVIGELEGRTANTVTLSKFGSNGHEILDVTNPKHVFSYPKFGEE